MKALPCRVVSWCRPVVLSSCRPVFLFIFLSLVLKRVEGVYNPRSLPRKVKLGMNSCSSQKR